VSTQLKNTPMRSVGESRMAQEGQANAGGVMKRYDNGEVYYDSAPLTEYPRMLYRKTDVEQTQEWADAVDTLKDPPMVINNYGTPKEPLLCDTCIAQNADEAETLSADGWEISAQAAHGLSSGIAAVATAKDARIAELEAQLAAQADFAERDEIAGTKPIERETLKAKPAS
jgi:hypothetical protein